MTVVCSITGRRGISNLGVGIDFLYQETILCEKFS
jgi:hypothetical protein